MRLFKIATAPASQVTARVKKAVCSLCEACVDACPYHARRADPETASIVVDPLACQGCGACATACPNSACVVGGFEDGEIMDAIEGALF